MGVPLTPPPRQRPVAVDVVAQVLGRVFVEPVRTGRLRRDDWPPGLLPVVAIGLAVYVLGLVGAVLGGQLRSVWPSDSPDGFPTALFGLLLVMMTVVVALVCTGCLHAPWPLTVVGLVLALVFGLGIAGWSQVWWAIVIQLGGWGGLVGFTVLRRRHGFAWWEYVVVQSLLGAAVGLAGWLTIRPLLDAGDLDLGNLPVLLLASVSLFALPTAVAAGVALTEVGLATSVWAVDTVAARSRPTVKAVLVGVLAAGVVAGVSWRWWFASLPVLPHLISTAAALVVLLATGLVWWLADRAGQAGRSGRAGREGREVREGPDGPPTRVAAAAALVSSARPVAVIAGVLAVLPVMAETALHFVQLGLRVVAQAAGGTALVGGLTGLPGISTQVLRGTGWLAAAVGCAAAAVLLTRRVAGGTAELFAVVAVLAAVRGLGVLGWLPARLSLDDLALVTVLVVVGLAVRWAGRHELTPDRLEAVATALLLGLAISQRELLADPLAWLLGGTAGVLLAFGLIWNLLTGAEDANADSARFPRPARALLVVANLALVMTVFGYNQVIVGPTLDLDGFVVEGAEVIGTGLLLTGVWVVLTVRDPVGRPH